MQGESMPGWDLTSQALRGPVPHEAIVCQVRRSSSGKRKLPLVREAGVWGSTSEAASSLSSRRQTSRTDGRVMRPPEPVRATVLQTGGHWPGAIHRRKEPFGC